MFEYVSGCKALQFHAMACRSLIRTRYFRRKPFFIILIYTRTIFQFLRTALHIKLPACDIFCAIYIYFIPRNSICYSLCNMHFAILTFVSRINSLKKYQCHTHIFSRIQIIISHIYISIYVYFSLSG